MCACPCIYCTYLLCCRNEVRTGMQYCPIPSGNAWFTQSVRCVVPEYLRTRLDVGRPAPSPSLAHARTHTRFSQTFHTLDRTRYVLPRTHTRVSPKPSTLWTDHDLYCCSYCNLDPMLLQAVSKSCNGDLICPALTTASYRSKYTTLVPSNMFPKRECSPKEVHRSFRGQTKYSNQEFHTSDRSRSRSSRC